MKATFTLFLISMATVLAVAHNSTRSLDYLKKNYNYGCPKNFVQVGRRCYFFSKHSATWQDAYYRCRHRKSNIAIIKTANQDKRIRKILSKPTHATKERWIGGRYDWMQMKWLWAASGRPLTYQGFSSTNFTDEQRWHCITMDPTLDYKWNTQLCTQKKPYICHTKTKPIKNFSEYSEEMTNNEIILPAKGNRREANYPPRPQELRYKNVSMQKRRKNRNRKLNNKTFILHRPIYRDMNSRGRRNHMAANRTDSNKIVPMEAIKYEIYKENTPVKNSLYPKPIVEEYTFMKSP